MNGKSSKEKSDKQFEYLQLTIEEPAEPFLLKEEKEIPYILILDILGEDNL